MTTDGHIFPTWTRSMRPGVAASLLGFHLPAQAALIDRAINLEHAIGELASIMQRDQLSMRRWVIATAQSALDCGPECVMNLALPLARAGADLDDIERRVRRVYGVGQ
jgi:hypothetical protein